ncbi:hypothetical protein PAUR_a3331 [Pseudoalteromonas aurantia 208]|uniref:Uncharacterized protein n=1 Tax=Pseudoalteromonas aurantia 208 TaxID=1314867 RepID=A0ABR9E5T1_9GAMM|nr:hypothetical protein [Pseudoalteromonas aurantia 208]
MTEILHEKYFGKKDYLKMKLKRHQADIITVDSMINSETNIRR